MRIIESLRNEGSIIPIEVEVFHTKLTKMRRHTLEEILDFLPVTNIMRKFFVCKTSSQPNIERLGLFGNTDIIANKPNMTHTQERSQSK